MARAKQGKEPIFKKTPDKKIKKSRKLTEESQEILSKFTKK